MSLTMTETAETVAPVPVAPEVDLDAPLVITRTMAIDLLTRAVAEKGANHTAACYYAAWTDGGLVPNCMVGYALSYVGVPLEELRQHNSLGIDYLRVSSVEIEPDARLVFTVAQDSQDEGAVWGRALDAAVEA